MKLSSIFSSSKLPLPPNQVGQSGQGNRSGEEGDTEGSIELIDRLDTPKMFRVLLINDDFTPMDFVVLVLKRFFSKDEQQATTIMLDVHQKGAGTAGVYILEMAEMKVMQVNQFARMNQHPLKATLEEIP
jgi:ATP-dependent Clp protease adaptor protein ClpS